MTTCWYHSPAGGPHKLEAQEGKSTDVCVHNVSVGVRCEECRAEWKAVKEEESDDRE